MSFSFQRWLQNHNQALTSPLVLASQASVPEASAVQSSSPVSPQTILDAALAASPPEVMAPVADSAITHLVQDLNTRPDALVEASSKFLQPFFPVSIELLTSYVLGLLSEL